MSEEIEAHRKAPVKPALKKDQQQYPAGKTGATSSGEATPEKKKKKGLKWDEEAIAEHDLLRGTRMKIDEPNTPYNYDSGAESDGSSKHSPRTQRTTAIDFNVLTDKLTTVAANPPVSPGGLSSGVSSEAEEEEKKQKFREARKNHYNEMELVKQFRMKHPGGAFDVNDDEEDGDDESED